MATALDILRAIQGGKKLNTMLARDIMTPNPSVVKKDTPVEEIIRIMVEKEIVLVPVVEDDNTNKLIGVAARLDIIKVKRRIHNNRKKRGAFKDISKPTAVYLSLMICY